MVLRRAPGRSPVADPVHPDELRSVFDVPIACAAAEQSRGIGQVMPLPTVAAIALIDVPTVSAPLAIAMPTPLDSLGADLVGSFTSVNLVWYGGAFLATGVMAFGGVDHAIRVGVQRSLRSPAYADGSFYSGYVLPALAAPAVYLVGLASHDPVTAGAGSAALQALAMTLVSTGVLKIATGRSYPLNGGDPGAADRLEHPEYARQFRPFQAFTSLPSWPSGHTSATVSIAAALTAYYPDQIWIPFVGYPIATVIGFGMVVRDSHWASDVVGGALVGHAIGYSVGCAFRKRVRGAGRRESSPVSVAPVFAPAFVGVTARGAW